VRCANAGRVRLLVFLFCFVVFSASPVTVLLDSQFALLTTESLLKNRTPALNGFRIAGLQPRALPAARGLAQPGRFYQLVRVHGRVLYDYPHGSCFLSLPFVALLDALGIPAVGSNGVYHLVAEVLQEKLLAALLMAAASAIFFEMGMRAGLPVSWSAAIAVGGALGTQVWSSASRTLWSQTWEVMLSSIAALLLLQGKQRGLRPIVLATLLAWMYFVRPTGAVALAAVTVYICLVYRSDAAVFLVTLAAWGLIFVFYWILIFGRPLPDYYRQGNLLGLTHIVEALPAILISPSRGLLVFVPTILMVLYLTVRYRAEIDRGLAILALTVISANVLLVAAFPNWWGGWSYGPRLLTGTIPWFLLLAVMAFRRLNADPRRRPMLTRLALGLTLLAIAMNGWGAISWSATMWSKDVGINAHPERVWDWRHPQFLAGF